MTCPFNFVILQIHFSRLLSQSLDIKNKNLQDCKTVGIHLRLFLFWIHMTTLTLENITAYSQKIWEILLLLWLMFVFSSNTATVECRCPSMINQKNKKQTTIINQFLHDMMHMAIDSPKSSVLTNFKTWHKECREYCHTHEYKGHY